MVFDSFNIQWSRDCVSKDYLFVGAVAKYTKVKYKQLSVNPKISTSSECGC